MREGPPKQLVERLERLKLASATQVRAAARRARRLARGLPLLESVWVDALSQARALTSFQAAEMNAGRGDALRVGPYLLCRRLPSPGYASWYLARHAETGKMAHLAVAEPGESESPEVLRRLETLAARGRGIADPRVVPIEAAGQDERRVWAAARHVPGRTAAEWLVHNGRFPPEVVMEIARQMAAALAAMEEARILHGGISAGGLLLTPSAEVALLLPGLRGAIRPVEGYAHADLPPEDFDTLAPERVEAGTPPDAASDIYACGCLWWHLLTGRPPIAGGDGQAKLKGIRTARIADVRRLAPETPEALANVVAACVRRSRADRPKSIAALAAMLGPPAYEGRKALARCAGRAGFRPRGHAEPSDLIARMRITPRRAAVAAGALALLAIVWALPRGETLQTAASIPAKVSILAKDSAKEKAARAEQAHDRGNSGTQDREKRARAAARNTPASAEQTDHILRGDQPHRLERLELRPGQVVRGEERNRPLVIVPSGGLVVEREDVRFENIDFVWEVSGPAAPEKGTSSEEGQQEAILQLRASRAEFRGCSFQPGKAAASAPAGILWRQPTEGDAGQLALPAGHLRLTDCVFRGGNAGIVCPTNGAVAVELINTLHLSPGPLVRLGHCPKADEPVAIRLAHVTVRNGGPLLECRYARMEEAPGSIVIEADGCVLAPDSPPAIIRFAGADSPERLFRRLRWSGQGSLVSPGVAVARWERPEGPSQPLDDASVTIAGLVRGEVEFTGDVPDSAESHQLVRWQAPMTSADPPGVDPKRLPRRRP